MAVFRIEKTRDYTVMSNHHLRNAGLSLKSKGLLSMMLSLPEDWNYTTRGLAKICKEGTDSIGSALKELERAGYIVRNRLRDSKGKIVDVEYVIYETPHSPDTGQPCEDEPDTACPDTENPDMDNPCLENRPQLNKEKRNPEEQNTHSPSTEESNPIQSSPQTPTGAKRTGRDWMREREGYRELILENIEYDILVQNERMDRDRLDELVELMVDTVCSRRETIRIAGDDYPAEVVKSRFLKLNSSHIEYVLDRMRENTTYVRNIKKYLLAALYNAPATIDSYYASLVRPAVSIGTLPPKGGLAYWYQCLTALFGVVSSNVKYWAGADAHPGDAGRPGQQDRPVPQGERPSCAAGAGGNRGGQQPHCFPGGRPGHPGRL